MDLSKLQSGMTIRCRLTAEIEGESHDFEGDGLFIEWIAETGYARVKLESGALLHLPPDRILGQVITYIEKKVVPF